MKDHDDNVPQNDDSTVSTGSSAYTPSATQETVGDVDAARGSTVNAHDVLAPGVDGVQNDSAVDGEHVNSDTKSTSVSDDYFSDDEMLERGDDTVVVSESALGIFQQMDGLVSWSIENVHREKNGEMEQKSPWELRKDPPELVVKTKAEDGSIIEFTMTLTQNVAQFAEDMFHQVNESYKGKSFEKKEKKPSIFSSDGFAYHTQEAKDWVGTNPWKSLLFLFIIVMLLITLW